ncbi:phospholipid-translocating P-type ATPase [Aureobasidium namibiae CBS 147.97]|uniref:Phospholipid-transporting ATPase n=1 Tax=Aureobasidium namibiae CBS 147.97 TaxID=1043004 RepID=A0A074W6B9_9PEZI|nr:phospholipid-translocating P-type ATPase [Aureobasidium namibiae CBS 147.97]KEQ68650.1 phospholipid-translocating P-type ATPase [Aureobasidium namibiae CBS 147.97]
MSHRHGDSTASASLIPDADSDLDLDLDLDELDPQTITTNNRSNDSSKNIALKNLRLGGRRAFRRPDRYVDDDADAEDLEALVGRDSQAHERDPLHAQDDDDEPEDEHDPASNRTIVVGDRQDAKYPPNAVSNAKYTPVSFLPRTLYNEFSFFFNMYFLLVALSQIIPQLRIGYLSTYIFPLLFVLAITLGKEAMDDIHRRRRDQEANSERYTVLQFGDNDTTNTTRRRNANPDADGLLNESVRETSKPSRLLKVGDVLVMTKDQRFPADVAILKSFSQESSAQPEPLPEPEEADLFGTTAAIVPELPLANQTTSEDPSAGGEAFIRTDQLDGETDWKLRLASPLTQDLPAREYTRLRLTAGKPDKRVNDFAGTLDLLPDGRQAYDPYESEAPAAEVPGTKSIPLSIDNTAWANTVLASSTTVYAVVIYTGPETRAALSTSASRSKTGLLENEINSLTKILCFLTLALSFLLVALKGFKAEKGQEWYVSVMRFLILFSTIVPISLRVNLDMGKSMYAWFIERDQGIPGTVVRTSTIPEDLGRIEYLLSDKTGTLTQNEMELKKIHVGTVSYANEAMDEVTGYVKSAFSDLQGGLASGTRSRREIGLRVRDLVLALALCHNVTPTTEEASSPDEIAIVAWTEQSITLQFVDNSKIVVRVQILNIFPFTSDSKRMGIVVKFVQEGGAEGDVSELYFFQKGADTVMTSIVAANDWLDEETANMAREGLRTLVIGRKAMSAQQYAAFSSAYAEASLSLHDRDNSMARVVKQHLENNLELLGVTGVEDKLQAHIKPSLELLRNAGIKIWMLTGDKVETARCVAVSSKLVSRGQYIHTIAGLKRKDLALDALSLLHSRPNAALLIDGESLSLYLTHHRDAFITLAVRLPAVIACRCSPTQKADVAKLIRNHTRKRIACIGDGGNDVSMIQAADVGVGIVGKEGRQASLAADFSITQFSHLTKLLVWHGRNSYKRSAKLAQFVIHRGLIISVCQTVFSVASAYQPIALYRDWLLVGYATLYTMAPVFSLTLDRDVDENLANLYPELYKELTLGKSLSYRTFFVWVAISVYQGIIIQGGSQLLVPKFAEHSTGNADTAAAFARMVSVSFTVLVINELIMVAAEITTWHPANIISILATGCLYFGSIPFLSGYFDLKFVASVGFVWRVAAISAVSLVPVYAGKLIRRAVKPPSYRKVQGV